MKLCIFILAAIVAQSLAFSDLTDLCHFDGHVYRTGEVISIGKCLAEMTCLGNESYGNLVQLGGVCKTARDVSDDGQTGCLFDGKVYNKGDTIIIPKCLAQMTCLGYNNYSEIKELYGICP